MKALTRSRLPGHGQHRSGAMAFGGMLFLVWALGGCDETIVAAAPTALVETTAVEANDDCPSGGQAITTGVDQNGNGVLDDSEITQRAMVCNGANGEVTVSHDFERRAVVPRPRLPPVRRRSVRRAPRSHR